LLLLTLRVLFAAPVRSRFVTARRSTSSRTPLLRKPEPPPLAESVDARCRNACGGDTGGVSEAESLKSTAEGPRAKRAYSGGVAPCEDVPLEKDLTDGARETEDMTGEVGDCSVSSETDTRGRESDGATSGTLGLAFLSLSLSLDLRMNALMVAGQNLPI
jgi:hypothetical protein